MDIPERFGSWKGVYTRLRNWAIDSTWAQVFTALVAEADAEGDSDWLVSVDSTIVRAHQQVAGARKKGASPASLPGQPVTSKMMVPFWLASPPGRRHNRGLTRG
ncbi:hypothetical protein GCM10009839_43620 [Catenulispora yoronensis]|uniref:Transposase n=2 Tax=Catenulispora yoronensis TaxID=450799 RepID=A0ABP5G520_9ACTN